MLNIDCRSCQLLVGVVKPVRGRTKVSLHHSLEISADMFAEEHQQHEEKDRTKITVCSQNELDGGKDASRARDKEV